jgi:hypothetical protein
MMGTGAITDAYVTREPAPPTMSEAEAIAAILAGHKAKVYELPKPLRNAAEAATAVSARAFAVHAELAAAEAALSSGAGRLVAEIVHLAASAGALPKLDAGAEMLHLEGEVTRLRHESSIFFVASEKIESYPVTILRSIAADVHTALDAALAELLQAAGPHSGLIAAVDPEAADPLVKAYKADPKGYEELEGLTGRLLTLEAAGQAMARLGRPWEAVPPDDGAPPVLRLATMAATTPGA